MSSAGLPPPPPDKPGIPGWFWVTLVAMIVVGIAGGVAIGFPLFGSSNDVATADYDQRVLCDQVERLATIDVEEYEDLDLADLEAMRGVVALAYAIEADSGDSKWSQLGADLVDAVANFALPEVESSLDAFVDRCDAEVL